MHVEQIGRQVGIEQALDLDARRERRSPQAHRGVDPGLGLVGEAFGLARRQRGRAAVFAAMRPTNPRGTPDLLVGIEPDLERVRGRVRSPFPESIIGSGPDMPRRKQRAPIARSSPDRHRPNPAFVSHPCEGPSSALHRGPVQPHGLPPGGAASPGQRPHPLPPRRSVPSRMPIRRGRQGRRDGRPRADGRSPPDRASRPVGVDGQVLLRSRGS